MERGKAPGGVGGRLDEARPYQIPYQILRLLTVNGRTDNIRKGITLETLCGSNGDKADASRLLPLKATYGHAASGLFN